MATTAFLHVVPAPAAVTTLPRSRYDVATVPVSASTLHQTSWDALGGTSTVRAEAVATVAIALASCVAFGAKSGQRRRSRLARCGLADMLLGTSGRPRNRSGAQKTVSTSDSAVDVADEPRRTSAAVSKLFGEKPQGPSLEEELAEIIRKGEEERRELEEKLKGSPAEVTTDMSKILQRNAEIKERMEKKKAARQAAIAVAAAAAAARRAEVASAAVESPAVSAVQPRPATPAAPWQLALDRPSGRWYYVNAETRASAWELPQAPPPQVARPAEPALPWALVSHVETGRWYYHNQLTGVTSWEAPQ